MSLEKETLDALMDLILRELSQRLPATLLSTDQKYFFMDTVTDYRDGVVRLRNGKTAEVLNGGDFQTNDPVLVIRTIDGALWAYYPFTGAVVKARKKIIELKDAYIYTYLDVSGSMDADAPAVQAMLVEFRKYVEQKVYGGNTARSKIFFPQTLDMGDERFLDWFTFTPSQTGTYTFKDAEGNNLPEGDFSQWVTIEDPVTTPYMMINMAFINEASPYDGGTHPTNTFTTDLHSFVEESKKRTQQKNIVFNVTSPGLEYFGEFLIKAKKSIGDSFEFYNVPPGQSSEYFTELLMSILKKWGSV